MDDRIKPTVASPRGRFTARVVKNVRICTDHYKLTLGLANFPASAAGQFVQIECREGSGGGNSEFRVQNSECGEGYRSFEWGPGAARPGVLDRDFAGALAYLRRPFSIAGRRDVAGETPAALRAGRPHHQTEIDVIHRVVGRGTVWLQGLKEGDEVSVLGPLGKGFWIPEGMELALLVGGGVGIPPMFYMAEALARAGKKAVGIVGAQRADLVPVTMLPGSGAPSAVGDPVMNAEEFGRYGYETVVATDDGSMGMKGFVTGALRRMLEKLKGNSELGRVVVYCCGPTPMMKATAKVCGEFGAGGVMCQVSLEQPMACGMGTCQSCVIKWKGPVGNSEFRVQNSEVAGETIGAAGQAWKYKLTCTDGPVFDSRELQW